MGVFQDADRELVKAATELGGNDQLRDQIVYVCAEILPILAVAVGLWIFFRSRTKRQRDKDQNVALLALAAVLIAVGLRWLVGEVVDRERPFETLRDLHYLGLVSPGSNSFPSLHTMILFAFAGTFYFIGHHPNWARFLLVLAAVVALARVAAGVHYPLDILAGAVLGLAVAKVVSWQSQWLDEQMK